MLSLSVSKLGCTPWSKRSAVPSETRPASCQACGAPGGEKGALLERHGSKRGIWLCPLCHACLHLDVAGKRGAGKVVWVPELTQQQLNLFALTTFLAVRKSRIPGQPETVVRVAKQAARIFEAFERRSEVVETFLMTAGKTPVPREKLSSPSYISSLIIKAQKDSELDAKAMAKRMEGLRLLPSPKAFEDYISAVARIVEKTLPIPAWVEPDQKPEGDGASSEGSAADESFDASDIAAAQEVKNA